MSELYSLMSSTEKDLFRFDYKEQAKPKGARIWNDKLVDHYQSHPTESCYLTLTQWNIQTSVF